LGSHVHYPLSRLWYRSHFPNVLYKRYLSKLHSRRMVTGESSPFYLTNHHAPGRIKTTLPDAKLVVILRNPVDRAYSDYHMSVRQHRQSMTFEDAVRHGYTAQAGHADLYRGSYAEHMGDHRRRLREQTAGYLSRGHYAEHLTRWFEHFDRDRFLILTLDELKADPRGGCDCQGL